MDSCILEARQNNRFIDTLDHHLQQNDANGRHHPEAFLGPTRRFLEREIPSDDGAFLFAAYDRFIRDAWKSRNYPIYRQRSIRQQELF